MKEISLVIIGAGNFGREVNALINRMNNVNSEEKIKVLGFVDDNPDVQGKTIDGIPVLGTVDWINDSSEDFYITCSIGTGRIREIVLNKINPDKKKLLTLIDPSAIFLGDCTIGDGAIICANNVISVNTRIGYNAIINLSCTVGHDSIVGDFCTVNPGTNISGCVEIGKCNDIGTGTKIIQGLTIVEGCTVGAGTVVVRSIDRKGTYVGVPAHLTKEKE